MECLGRQDDRARIHLTTQGKSMNGTHVLNIDLPSALYDAARKLAKERGISLTRLARDAIAAETRSFKAPEAAREPSGKIGNSLDEFIGVWSKDEEQEFLKSIEVFGQIDADMWK